MKRAEIEAELLAWIAEGVDAPRDDARFERLALALFATQYAHGESFRRLCDAFDRRPARVSRWQDIPAVPTGAFKEARLAVFDEADTVRTFRTSGSTTERRGALHLDTLRIYDASLLATLRAFVCPDVERMRFLVMAPSAAEVPDSSLSYMFEHALREIGSTRSRFCMQPTELIAELRGLDEPIALCGTAFAFVHLMDALQARGRKLALVEGSRVMETGGFKGRSRELTREQLHDGIARYLGVPANRIVNQYGMCELGSQFYEPTLRTGVPTHVKRIPPWVRTRAVDPATLNEVPEGEIGVLQHFDLANTGSVLAVQTSDEGRLYEGGLELLGRIEGAEARGCSIAADGLLAAQPEGR